MKNHQIHSAVILTAGIGKRLKPLTNHTHKALLPVNNQPALQLIIDKLKAINIDNFYLNTFHLADQVERFLDNQHDLNKTIIREKTLRNTGGGIANFRYVLNHETFLLHNCDVYSEEDLSKLIKCHLDNNNIATLMVVDYPGINTVKVENDKVVDFRSGNGNCTNSGFQSAVTCPHVTEKQELNCNTQSAVTCPHVTEAHCTYSGVAVFSPKIWKYFPYDEVFSIVPVLESAMNNGENIGAYLSNAYWNDFGTPERYQKLQRYLSIDERKSLLNQP